MGRALSCATVIKASGRRSFPVRLIGILLLICLGLSSFVIRGTCQTGIPVADRLADSIENRKSKIENEQDGVVHSKRLPDGMPLGGIGTGTFQLMTDGAISRATYNNNWAQPTGDLPGCFAALWTRARDHSTARVLALQNAYHLPTVAALDFEGLAPQALLTFPVAETPVTVSLRAFSPLIPFDLRDSSFPAGAFVLYVANPSPVEVEISVALSWENTLGIGQGADNAPISDRTGNAVQALPDTEGYFGMRFTGPPRPPANIPFDPTLENARGDMTLLAYAPRKEAVVTTAGWNARDAHPGWWDGFAKSGQVAGEAPIGQEGKVHPAGVVAIKLTLKPGDSVEIPFAIAWYTPALRTPEGSDYGHYYQVAFPDSHHAARALLEDWRSLLALTEEWQKRLLYSDLPPWLTRRLINSVMPLTSHTLHTRDGRFAWLRETGMPTEGSPVRTDGVNREPSLQASSLLLAFFPQIQARRLDQFLAAQTPEGAFPGDWRDPFHQLGPPPRQVIAPSEIGNDSPLLLDPALNPFRPVTPTLVPSLFSAESAGTTNSFVLQLAQYVFWTGDRTFLYQGMPGLRRILTHQIRNVDADGLPPAASAISRGKLRPTTLISWLAALKAGQRLAQMAERLAFVETPPTGFFGKVPDAFAEIAADRQFAALCESAFVRAQAGISKVLANGLLATEPEGVPLFSPEVAALLGSDFLSGTWTADQLGLGPLLPEATLQEWQKQLRREPRPDGTPAAPLQGHTGDWNALYALQGFRYDGIAQQLTLTPQIPGTWRTLTCPVFAPTFWGRLQFKPTAHGSVLILRVDQVISLSAAVPAHKSFGSIGGARFILRSLRVPGPPFEENAAETSGIHVSLGPNPVGFQITRDPSGDRILTFSTPLTLVAGSRLEVELH